MQPYGVSIETAVSCYLRLGIAALQVPQSANCIFASQKQHHASTLHIKLHNLPTCKRREEANTSILVCIEMVNKESASRAKHIAPLAFPMSKSRSVPIGQMPCQTVG